MAMSETPSKPIDWTQFYHLSSGQAVAPPPSSAVAESIVVTTTTSTPAGNPNNLGPGAASYSQIEGRVGKSSARRRSRASRRAPTTLLNTDTTNFRAMVQQFTGVPTVPFSSGAYQASGAGGMTLGFGAQHSRQQPVVTPTPQEYYPRHHLQQQQQQQQRQQQDGAMFSLAHGNESFHPVFTNPRPTSDFSEDHFLEILSSSSSQILPRQSNPGQNNNNSGNHGYIL